MNASAGKPEMYTVRFLGVVCSNLIAGSEALYLQSGLSPSEVKFLNSGSPVTKTFPCWIALSPQFQLL